jgi:hypothetical protein
MISAANQFHRLFSCMQQAENIQAELLVEMLGNLANGFEIIDS